MKALHVFNLAGVLALAVLCVLQWRDNRSLNHEVIRLEEARIAHEQVLKEQKLAVENLTTDRDEFRERFKVVNAEAVKARRELGETRREVAQLTTERDQLRESVTNWAAAVKQRDMLLTNANERIKGLADDLNANVARFNDLATNHNDLVIRYNELATNRNDVVKRYNDLVEQVNKERAKGR
jgi:methyl-accepting chemotaxis protein